METIGTFAVLIAVVVVIGMTICFVITARMYSVQWRAIRSQAVMAYERLSICPYSEIHIRIADQPGDSGAKRHGQMMRLSRQARGLGALTTFELSPGFGELALRTDTIFHDLKRFECVFLVLMVGHQLAHWGYIVKVGALNSLTEEWDDLLEKNVPYDLVALRDAA